MSVTMNRPVAATETREDGVAAHVAPGVQRAPIAAPMSQSEYDYVLADTRVSATTKEQLANGSIRTYADCPSDLIASLGRWAYGDPDTGSKPHVTTDEIGWFTLDEIYGWSGLQEVALQRKQAIDESGNPVVDKDGNPVMVIDKDSTLFHHFAISIGKGKTAEQKRILLANQMDNRPIDFEKCKALAYTYAAGLWAANGEPFIFDSLGNGASCQHRTGAIKYAELKLGFTGPVPLIITRGIPALVVNTIDTGRTRTTGHIFYRDPSVLVPDTLRDIDGKEYAPNIISEKRQKLANDLSSVGLLLFYRLGGRDVNASIGSSLDATTTHIAKNRVVRAFEPLEALVQAVYNHDTGVEGKSTFGGKASRPYVAAALCLYFASKQEEGYVEPQTLEPGQFLIDMDMAKEFLQALEVARTADTPLGHMWRNYASQTKLTNREKFGAVCNMVAYHFDGEFICRSKSEGNPVPHANAIVSGRGVTPSYPHFGGPDTPSKLREGHKASE